VIDDAVDEVIEEVMAKGGSVTWTTARRTTPRIPLIGAIGAVTQRAVASYLY
jgi:hypothetical protein